LPLWGSRSSSTTWRSICPSCALFEGPDNLRSTPGRRTRSPRALAARALARRRGARRCGRRLIALSDATTTAHLFLVLAERWRERGIRSLAELAAVSQDALRMPRS
jgi:hypothetical protein